MTNIEKIVWLIIVALMGALAYHFFWLIPENTSRCKELYGSDSRLVSMGRLAEKACMGPDGTPRYLP